MCCKVDLSCSDIIRIIIVLSAGLLSLTVIGYQAIIPVLEKEGLFENLCNKTENNNNIICKSQSLRFDLMFFITISVMNIFCLIWGIIIKFHGIKLSVLLGGIVMSISSFLFGFANDWLCFFSYIGIGIGAFGVLFGAVSVPPQYPSIAGHLSSALTGTMDASSGVFYIIFILYKYKNVSMQLLFIILAILILIITLLLYFYVFASYFDSNLQRMVSSSQQQQQQQIDEIDEIDYVELTDKNEKDEKDDNKQKISSQENIFKSKKFISIILWSSSLFITKYFYIATIDEQLELITNYEKKESVDRGQHIFSIMLLSSGLFTIICGPLIDKFGMKISLRTMGIIALISSILSAINIFELQYITMLGMVFNRFFYFAVIPLLVVNVYGPQQMQFILGIVMFISAIFNFLSYPLNYIALNVFNGFAAINIILGIASFVTSMWISFYVIK